MKHHDPKPESLTPPAPRGAQAPLPEVDAITIAEQHMPGLTHAQRGMVSNLLRELARARREVVRLRAELEPAEVACLSELWTRVFGPGFDAAAPASLGDIRDAFLRYHREMGGGR